ncbi:MAG: hypothetical protein AB1782_16300 [Cyanobacteriota bacterium]
MHNRRSAQSDAVRLLLKIAEIRRLNARANIDLYNKARQNNNLKLLSFKGCI